MEVSPLPTEIWHTVSMTIPFPSTTQAALVKRVVDVDKPLRPTEVKRELKVNGLDLIIEFQARTISQARVALDHALSDIQLIVQTMHKFAPRDQLEGNEEEGMGGTAASIEIGMRGVWEGIKR